MREIHERVVTRLKARRDPAGAIRLWERLWTAYDEGGPDGLDELLDSLAAWPEDEEEEDQP